MDNLLVLSLFAMSPIIVVGFLLVGLRWPAKRAMPVGFVVVVLVALFVWNVWRSLRRGEDATADPSIFKTIC